MGAKNKGLIGQVAKQKAKQLEQKLGGKPVKVPLPGAPKKIQRPY